MVQPTRAAQVIDTLPTLYYQDPLLRRLIDAFAGRLAEAQADGALVLNAHWADTADQAPFPADGHLADLPRIAALAPLVPFPDEEEATRAAHTVLVAAGTPIAGQSGAVLRFDQLQVGQRLFIRGTQRADGAVVASRISVAIPLGPDPQSAPDLFAGRLARVTPATALDPLGALIVLTGLEGPEMFRQRLKMTVEAFLEGAGTAPALLKMAAATMGWGPLQGSFADWSRTWKPEDPIFEAWAEGAPAPLRLRELPLRAATTPIPHRVGVGERWIETNRGIFAVEPSVQFKPLDQPVVVPTLVNLEAGVAIAAFVVLEPVKLVDGALVRQDVMLRIGQINGNLRGTLIERALPAGGVTETDVTGLIRARAAGLQLDKPGASGFLQGGADDRAASLTVTDGRQVLHLSARTEGAWGNAIQIMAAPEGGTLQVALRYNPAWAASPDATGRDSPALYEEALAAGELLAGKSKLVTAHDLTFPLPRGDSRWFYFDHMGWGVFDVSRWDQVVFDAPPEAVTDPEARLARYPARGYFDYTDFDAALFPPDIVRAYRFDAPDALFDTALFSGTPEQVEVLLGWQEAQPATVRLDVPLTGERDYRRLAFLPEMLRKVKAAGVKVILASRFLEDQPLGDALPRVRLRNREPQPLGDAACLRISLGDSQSMGERLICVFDGSHWDGAHFETRSA